MTFLFADGGSTYVPRTSFMMYLSSTVGDFLAEAAEPVSGELAFLSDFLPKKGMMLRRAPPGGQVANNNRVSAAAISHTITLLTTLLS